MKTQPDIVLGVLWYLVFVISTTFHEAAHSFAGWRLGDNTAYNAGQVTLNPVPHIKREPFGMIVAPILSYAFGGWMIGWASAPYDPAWAMQYPKRSALMGLSGPAANLLLVLAAAALIRIGIAAGFFTAPERINFTSVTMAVKDGPLQGLAVMLSILFTLNLILFVFNLLPIPPLDGTSIAELILSGDLLTRYRSLIYGSGVSQFGIIIAWFVMGKIYQPVHLIAINLLYPGTGYH